MRRSVEFPLFSGSPILFHGSGERESDTKSERETLHIFHSRNQMAYDILRLSSFLHTPELFFLASFRSLGSHKRETFALEFRTVK